MFPAPYTNLLDNLKPSDICIEKNTPLGSVTTHLTCKV